MAVDDGRILFLSLAWRRQLAPLVGRRSQKPLTHILRGLANYNWQNGCKQCNQISVESSSSFPFFKRKISLASLICKEHALSEISERFGSQYHGSVWAGKVDVHACESLLSNCLEGATGKAGNGKHEHKKTGMGICAESSMGRDQMTPTRSL